MQGGRQNVQRVTVKVKLHRVLYRNIGFLNWVVVNGECWNLPPQCPTPISSFAQLKGNFAPLHVAIAITDTVDGGWRRYLILVHRQPGNLDGGCPSTRIDNKLSH